MKLNYKRTLLVGTAFLSICTFWQLYDSLIPLILKNTFGFGESTTGTIMAIDNVLALFMLPFFGHLSDNTHTRLGKRTPYIISGTAIAVIAMLLLPIFDNAVNLFGFAISLGIVLLSMATYRSPAVSLMPDVTPKPLRSKGNAVINLMGAVGGVIALDAVGVNPQAEVGEDHAAIAAFVLSGQMEGRTMDECERDFKRFAKRVKRHLNELAEAVNATLAEGFATYVKPAPAKGPAQTTPSGVGWWLSYAEAICGDYGWSWKETLSTPLATVFALTTAHRERYRIDHGDSDYVERAYIALKKARGEW